jgi:serpin B
MKRMRQGNLAAKWGGVVVLLLGIGPLANGLAATPQVGNGLLRTPGDLVFLLPAGSLMPGILPVGGQPGAGASEPIGPHERAVLSDDALSVAASNNQFALELYQRYTAQVPAENNLLISPLSIATALAMTSTGAQGNTARQMADVLHFELPAERLHPAYGQLLADLDTPREGYQLNIANRLFGQQGFAFKDPFIETLAGPYAAPLEMLDFQRNAEGSRQHINDWVEGKTNGLIQNLLPEGSVHDDTRLVLANAIYFNGAWKYAFDERTTRTDSFITTDSTPVVVPMMSQQQTFRYAVQDDFQILEMPYAGDDLSMVVMLPDTADGLAGLEAALTPALLEESLEAMSSREVRVQLPKFTFDDSMELSSILSNLGMPDAFGNSADFGGMADTDLAIDGVVHKTFIDVSEKGTEAAAATGITIGTTSVVIDPSPPPLFRADHPFLFALRDTHSDSLLFLGRVTQPDELQSPSTSVPEPSSALLCLLALLARIFYKHRDSRITDT